MRTLIIPFALAGCALLTTTAHADQCQWVDAAVARKAEAILAKQPKVIAFCEPCGDQAPGIPAVAKTVSLETPQGDFREVIINGRGVDLAYTFVKTSDSTYKNLAKLTGCPAEGVSPRLTIEDETPHGVLIMPDETPIPEPRPEPIVQTTPAPPPPAPTVTVTPPTVFVYATTTQMFPWLAVLLACMAGFMAGALGLMTAALLRRRRTMRPRATDLPSP